MAVGIKLLCATLLVFCCAGVELTLGDTFQRYKQAYGRSYADGSEEHKRREAIFKKRVAEALEHNAQNRSWVKGINHLSDFTDEELDHRFGYKPVRSAASSASVGGQSFLEHAEALAVESCSSERAKCLESVDSCCSGLVCGAQGVCEKAKRLDTFDWSDELSTSHSVLEQGHCGSCWAVAATAALNLHAEIVTSKRFKKILSPQNLLACTPNHMECGGQGGCKGATAELAFDWLKNRGAKGGLYTMEDQDYSGDDRKCTAKPMSFLLRRVPPSITITGWRKIKENSAEEMMTTLTTAGPLVASVAARGLHGYKKGVVDVCGDLTLNHAVVMMGYGHDPTHNMPYWNVRNSWGPDWGENGFFRLRRFATLSGGEEPCGWDTDPSKGVVCKDKAGPNGKYPEKQWVCGACGILSDTSFPIGTHVPEALLEADSRSELRSRAGKHAGDRVEVKNNRWCKMQCQHFAMPMLQEAFGAVFDSDPGACVTQCDRRVPA